MRSVVEHMRLVDAVDVSFPIVLGPDGRVLDGMHRIARALREGLATIAARRLAVLPEPDFVGVAVEDLPYGH